LSIAVVEDKTREIPRFEVRSFVAFLGGDLQHSAPSTERAVHVPGLAADSSALDVKQIGMHGERTSPHSPPIIEAIELQAISCHRV
jgi:hypothetical protein